MRKIMKGQIYCSINHSPMGSRYSSVMPEKSSLERTVSSIRPVPGVTRSPYLGDSKPRRSVGKLSKLTRKDWKKIAATADYQHENRKEEQKTASIKGRTGQISHRQKEIAEISHGWNEISATKYQRTKDGENGMQQTEMTTTEKNGREGTRETHSEGSIEQYLTSAMVESPSMNLLDDTAAHLHGLMKRMTPETTDLTNNSSADVVNSACNAAKNIREIMKLKLDAMKLQHEVNKEVGTYKNGEVNKEKRNEKNQT